MLGCPVLAGNGKVDVNESTRLWYVAGDPKQPTTVCEMCFDKFVRRWAPRLAKQATVTPHEDGMTCAVYESFAGRGTSAFQRCAFDSAAVDDETIGPNRTIVTLNDANYTNGLQCCVSCFVGGFRNVYPGAKCASPTTSAERGPGCGFQAWRDKHASQIRLCSDALVMDLVDEETGWPVRRKIMASATESKELASTTTSTTSTATETKLQQPSTCHVTVQLPTDDNLFTIQLRCTVNGQRNWRVIDVMVDDVPTDSTGDSPLFLEANKTTATAVPVVPTTWDIVLRFTDDAAESKRATATLHLTFVRNKRTKPTREQSLQAKCKQLKEECKIIEANLEALIAELRKAEAQLEAKQ